MKFNVKTKVNAPIEHVWGNFNRNLFLKLAPVFPPLTLLRFDGCKVGDIVCLKLGFIFFSQIWESHVIAQETKENEISFIDEGKKLPFFLKYWQHTHILQKNADNTTTIIDAISYKSPFWLDYLFFPLLYLTFAYRIPIYKKFFKK